MEREDAIQKQASRLSILINSNAMKEFGFDIERRQLLIAFGNKQETYQFRLT